MHICCIQTLLKRERDAVAAPQCWATYPCKWYRRVLTQSHRHSTPMLPPHILQLPLPQKPLTHLLTLGELFQPPSQAEGRQERTNSLPPLGSVPKTLPKPLNVCSHCSSSPLFSKQPTGLITSHLYISSLFPQCSIPPAFSAMTTHPSMPPSYTYTQTQIGILAMETLQENWSMLSHAF